MAGRRQQLDDMVIGTMVHLPVKSLIRFRCVSKFWHGLIKSPTFINNHFLKRHKQGSIMLVRSYLCPPNYDDILSFRNMNSPDLEEVLPNLSIPFLKDLKYNNHQLPGNVFLLGPCSGLVCIAYGDCIIFSNPALREFKLLPHCSFSCPEDYVEDILALGFGKSCTNDFKCVLIRSTNQKRYSPLEYCAIIHLYNLSTDSWRQVDNNDMLKIYVDHDICREVLLNSNCHWIARSNLMENDDNVILCFDFSSEVFTQLVYPDRLKMLDKTIRWLTVVSECLVLLRAELMMEPFLIEGWMMKEYGVKESWTKQFVMGPYPHISYPLVPWRHDEWLLVETRDGQLASYALHTNQIEKFQVYGVKYTLRALIYKESLVTLNKGTLMSRGSYATN